MNSITAGTNKEMRKRMIINCVIRIIVLAFLSFERCQQYIVAGALNYTKQLNKLKMAAYVSNSNMFCTLHMTTKDYSCSTRSSTNDLEKNFSQICDSISKGR